MSVAPISNKAITPSFDDRTVVEKFLDLVIRVVDTVFYSFQLIQLWFTYDLFSISSPPTPIPNQGNTCFAAAWMQLVAMNQVLSGAYRSTLKTNLISRLFGGRHYAVKVLDQYRAKQADPRKRIDINQLRNAYQSWWRYFTQEDASELAVKIQNQMSMTSNGEVTLEDKSRASFGCRMEAHLPISGIWRPLEQGYSIPSLQLNSMASSFERMVREEHSGQLRLLDVPSVLTFHINRNQGGLPDTRSISVPLFYTPPRELLGPGLPRPTFMLQGFVSHSLGSTDGGHYIAYVQSNGKFYRMNDGQRIEVSIGQFLRAAKSATSLNFSRVS